MKLYYKNIFECVIKTPHYFTVIVRLSFRSSARQFANWKSMNFYKYNIIKEKVCTMVHLFVLVFVFDFVLLHFLFIL